MQEARMDRLLQQFEALLARGGETYTVSVYGRSRPADTWIGWLVFERQRDGRRFSTPAETTQPDEPAIIYWASGLEKTYLDGALDRALGAAGEERDSTSTSHESTFTAGTT
jgi:hypothetical protein